MKFGELFRHFLLSVWDFFQNFSSRFGSGNGARQGTGGWTVIEIPSTPRPGRPQRARPITARGTASSSRGRFSSSRCIRGPPLLPPATLVLCGVPSSHWPATSRWHLRHGRPPSATHGSATASRRPRVRAAEPLAPGRRLPLRWRMRARRGDGQHTARVAARLRRASHGAEAWWHVGAQFADERGTSLGPVDNGPRDGKTAANSSSSYRITQMNELVLGLNISSHMQFESSKGNTLNDQAHYLPQPPDHEQ